MKMLPQSFKKSERLCSKKTIKELFERGKSFTNYPFRIVWIVSDLKMIYPAQAAISVSKKYFGKAVTRNKIKRQIREVYRKNKSIIYSFLEKQNVKVAFFIIYVAKEQLTFKETEEKLISALKKFEQEFIRKFGSMTDTVGK